MTLLMTERKTWARLTTPKTLETFQETSRIVEMVSATFQDS